MVAIPLCLKYQQSINNAQYNAQYNYVFIRKQLRIFVPHWDHHQTITYKLLKKSDTHTKSYTFYEIPQ